MLLLVIASIFASILLTPIVRNFAWRVDAVSRPDGDRRTHARPTPELGGLAVLGALTLAVCGALAAGIEPKMDPWLILGLGVSAAMYCALGFIDDRIEMRARTKLLGQFLSALPIVVAGCWMREVNLFGWIVPLGLIGVPCAIAWILLVVNAMNLIDGMDGQASSIGIVAALSIGLIGALQDQPMVMFMGCGLAGALAGFLLYNLPPAKIYLGDCGSMIVGFLLAVLAMQASTAEQSMNVTVAGAVLFLPLIDTTLAVVRRLASGRGIMAGDREHIHHRLQDRGLSVWKALGLVTSLCMFCGGLAILAALVAWHAVVWIALASMMVVCVRMRLFGDNEVAAVARLLRRRVARRRTAFARSNAAAANVFAVQDAEMLDADPRPSLAASEEKVAA